jgi:hypothetical protein
MRLAGLLNRSAQGKCIFHLDSTLAKTGTLYLHYLKQSIMLASLKQLNMLRDPDDELIDEAESLIQSDKA